VDSDAHLHFVVAEHECRLSGGGDCAGGESDSHRSRSLVHADAEGFERGTTQELLTFIYIARGSAGEVRSMLCLLERLDRFQDLKSEISNLKSLALSVSRQLRGWAASLQNSEIKGQRYLTDDNRRTSQAAREREEFLDKLRKAQEERIANLQKSRHA